MTAKGCFTYDKDTTYVTLKPCLPTEEANQVARWDKTDIVFDNVVDAKLGKYLKVSDELNYLQVGLKIVPMRIFWVYPCRLH